jgi:hypothetical protein
MAETGAWAMVLRRFVPSTVTIATVAACVLVTTAGLGAAERRHFDDPYSIMVPEEPWLAPKYKSPRNLPQKPNSARTRPLPPRSSVGVANPPPPTILPNGQTVPNLPSANRGYVPGGNAETFQDRAARCAHQSGLYGVPGSQQQTYMSACVQ